VKDSTSFAARAGSLTEDQERVIADAVVKYLEKGDWRIERGPPAEGASGLKRGA
jgi:hypothetical protein